MKTIWFILGLAVLFVASIPLIIDRYMRLNKYNNIHKSNAIGLLVLFVFFVAIVGNNFFNWSENQRIIFKTKKSANYIAKGFADDNREIINKWALGEFKDYWDNNFIAKSKDGEIGYRFVSKGPDGILNTKDDISGEVYKLK